MKCCQRGARSRRERSRIYNWAAKPKRPRNPIQIGVSSQDRVELVAAKQWIAEPERELAIAQRAVKLLKEKARAPRSHLQTQIEARRDEVTVRPCWERRLPSTCDASTLDRTHALGITASHLKIAAERDNLPRLPLHLRRGTALLCPLPPSENIIAHMETFWATVAQVIPLFTLAAAIEIRSFAAQWYSLPAWLRSVQAAMWGLFFGGSAIIEIVALRTLSGSEFGDWTVTLAQYSLASGVGILLVLPAIELARQSFFPLHIRARAMNPRLRLRLWVQGRRAQRLRMVLKRGVQDEDILRSTIFATKTELDAKLARLESWRLQVATIPISDSERKTIQEEFAQQAAELSASLNEQRLLGERSDQRRISGSEVDQDLQQLLKEIAKTETEYRAGRLAMITKIEEVAFSVPFGFNPLFPRSAIDVDALTRVVDHRLQRSRRRAQARNRTKYRPIKRRLRP